MSERFWNNLAIVGTVTLCSFMGLYLGIGVGRAEMKRWQDDYYAAHPVVKEVAPPIDKAGLELAYLAGANWGVQTTLEECRKRFAAPKSKRRK